MILVGAIKNSAAAIARLAKVRRALTPAEITPIVEGVAQVTLAHVVEATPKKWTGQVRRAWRVLRPHPTLRIVSNENKVMRFLEFGTGGAGTGFIYPKTKKVLFIPLTRRASYGWRPGMKYGIDYVLRARVRGIKPRKIVAAERELAKLRLKAAMVKHLERSIT